jgi:transposase
MAAAKRALRTLARRIQSLEQEIEVLLSDLDSLTQAVCPGLRQTCGVGVDSAATLLTAAGDNPERFRSDAGFAALCGVSPLPASSGKTNRHLAAHKVVGALVGVADAVEGEPCPPGA